MSSKLLIAQIKVNLVKWIVCRLFFFRVCFYYCCCCSRCANSIRFVFVCHTTYVRMWACVCLNVLYAWIFVHFAFDAFVARYFFLSCSSACFFSVVHSHPMSFELRVYCFKSFNNFYVILRKFTRIPVVRVCVCVFVYEWYWLDCDCMRPVSTKYIQITLKSIEMRNKLIALTYANWHLLHGTCI